ncbi:MAG: HypC/HybG/HupF family hydrogenase formation chaperone [Deltaproteobacteria bacterium]|nr:HypC/HybG/HupF family hydrogenase formation chaperone [Deltaproteobacteria bacterium]
MCLAIPVKVIKIDGNKDAPFALVAWNGIKRRVSTILVDDVKKGDFVLIHAGCAIQKLDRVEAKERIKLINKLTPGTA